MREDKYYLYKRFISRGLSSFQKGVLHSRYNLGQIYRITPFNDVLEIGCGSAQLGKDIIGVFPQVNYTGINRLVSHSGYGGSNKNFPSNIKLIECDATEIPLKSESFDLILSQVTFGHIFDKIKALEEVIRLLRPGKKAFIGIDGWHLKKSLPTGCRDPFYRELYDTLGYEATPRLILKRDGRFISLRDYLSEIPGSSGVSFSIWTNVRHREDAIEPFFVTTLIVEKLSRSHELVFCGLHHDKIESKRLSGLPCVSTNPASWGWVDMYRMS